MSAHGRAEVIRVVRVARGEKGWEGVLQHSLDTLSFELARAPEGWAICGPARSPRYFDELEFLMTYESMLFTEINEARWAPGVGHDDVARHADAVIKAGREGVPAAAP
jgi:hypothetical protein